MRNPQIVATALALCALAAPAATEISVTRIQPRFPWNNGVDIDYEISGREGCAEEYQVCLAVSAKTKSFPKAARW